MKQKPGKGDKHQQPRHGVSPFHKVLGGGWECLRGREFLEEVVHWEWPSEPSPISCLLLISVFWLFIQCDWLVSCSFLAMVDSILSAVRENEPPLPPWTASCHSSGKFWKTNSKAKTMLLVGWKWRWRLNFNVWLGSAVGTSSACVFKGVHVYRPIVSRFFLPYDADPAFRLPVLSQVHKLLTFYGPLRSAP